MKLPRHIAGYEFVELLGTGSFGTVYRAILRGELGFEQEVAIKVLDSARAHFDHTLIASLANEARILSHVQHPNIVQARHFIAVDDPALGETHALVLEYVRGQSLRRLLDDEHRKGGRHLPITAALQVMSEVADALHFAHRLTGDDGERVGLVHRDLKPDNIHVTNEGRIKVLDFGIAWARRRLGESTQGGWTKGTPAYMSPEQLIGTRLDGRSDLYSLGQIGFELLTGERFIPPIRGAGNPLTAAAQIKFEDRERVLVDALEDRYGLDPEAEHTWELIRLLKDLLRTNREDRPATGGEVFDRLEDLPSLHRPSSGRGHLRRWVAKRNNLIVTDAESQPVQVSPTVLLPRRGAVEDEETEG
ncbi:MAG: serine/threonine protein kinase [Proteobacteria bacterium]|nr:serine/threonine protein kinase [Pseudomonadota bacterium]